MLIISREVPVKVGKHAWNVFPLEVFGFLLGRKADSAVYAALPCSKTKRWDEFGDRWIGIEDNIEKARSVGKLFDMDVVGFYASTDIDHQEDFPMPPFIASVSPRRAQSLLRRMKWDSQGWATCRPTCKTSGAMRFALR